MANVIDQINLELDRLGISSDFEPCSGLTVTQHSTDSDLVVIKDDYVSGDYNAAKVLGLLQDLGLYADYLSSESESNIWQILSDAEVE